MGPFTTKAAEDFRDVDADARMRAFERRQQLRDDFAFAAHRPEADDGVVAALRAAGAKDRGGAGASERGKQPAPVAATCVIPPRSGLRPLAAPRGGGVRRSGRPFASHLTSAVSQPPVNPARERPERTYGLSRITFQMRPLR